MALNSLGFFKDQEEQPEPDKEDSQIWHQSTFSKAKDEIKLRDELID